MGTKFSAPVQTGPGAYPASRTMGTGFFGGKTAGAWLWTPPASRIEVKKE